ncbi:hypothetical protein [Achromobacter xylosoxidans]|jgi:hypothetical protein|uniref:hypothetical protein n=1 Tax=Alcaligenes xylosoxydans xylosoxydans TaxID=85698 RepID=UPI0006C64F43|nr:hypothetical protein [Achromobacter xylosoxidans]QQE57436.1 hypothetical protein I6H41_31980 [Achromobacter xylosoxidans]QQV17075.1 hypothetical protein I6I48_14920 [Achromobacter xylosoxidans]CUI48601.1 Uncharacterised protein [Achromobacter xylosoxidans]
MNTISASAPPARIRPLALGAKVCRRLGGLIAPRDHAGKGNWSKDADIPPLVGWVAGLAFAAFVLFGRQVIGWLLHFAI